MPPNTIMTDEEKRLLNEEIEAWKTLPTDVETIIREVIGARIEEEIHQLNESIVRLDEFATVEVAQILEQLREASDEFEHRITTSSDGLKQSFADVQASLTLLADTLESKVPEVLETSRQTLQSVWETTQDMVENDLLEKIQSQTSESVDATRSRVDAFGKQMEENVVGFVNETERKIRELGERLDGFFQEWKDKVTLVQRTYQNLISDVKELEQTATTLVETVQLGVRSTGIGVNSATTVIGEIMAIMESLNS